MKGNPYLLSRTASWEASSSPVDDLFLQPRAHHMSSSSRDQNLPLLWCLCMETQLLIYVPTTHCQALLSAGSALSSRLSTRDEKWFQRHSQSRERSRWFHNLHQMCVCACVFVYVVCAHTCTSSYKEKLQDRETERIKFELIGQSYSISKNSEKESFRS